jgi:hypothetical protein
MECEKVRDRFSSLLEGDLDPLDEKVVKEHLASCPDCQKDFEKFEKTVRWLHSVEEAEVPEGFLSGIYKKMEDRKKTGLMAEKARPGWLNYLVQLKLPIQAVAMVAIVFLTLYLTKMMPFETPSSKDVGQKKVSQPDVKMEAKLVAKEGEKKREAAAPIVEAPRLKESEKAEVPPAKAGKRAMQVIAEERAFLAAKPPQEIVLKIANREKALSQIRELVKHWGGEIVKEEGNIVLASVPTASFSEFRKEIEGMSSLKKAEPAAFRKEVPRDLSSSQRARKEEVAGKELVGPTADQASCMTVEIRLLQE